jgi:hypothetical protein
MPEMRPLAVVSDRMTSSVVRRPRASVRGSMRQAADLSERRGDTETTKRGMIHLT